MRLKIRMESQIPSPINRKGDFSLIHLGSLGHLGFLTRSLSAMMLKLILFLLLYQSLERIPHLPQPLLQ